MPVTDIRKKFPARRVYRGSQVVFGERQHLREVLRSMQSARIPHSRKQEEIRQIRALIRARTEELNRINPAWDRKYRQALDPESPPQTLHKLGTALPEKDFLLARALTEHPKAPRELLARLATHSYPAVRENVARHPSTPAETLRQLGENSNEPLWFLVSCNPSTPPDLRERLRARMRAGTGIP
jgi:hypothetical protein